MTTLGILTIATNNYLDYWFDQVSSLASHPNGDLCITIHVFTDQRIRAQQLSSNIPFPVIVHDIPNYVWPKASLYRYDIFSSFRDQIGEEILMHLDADMIFRSGITSTQLKQPMRNGICLVKHPGFFRPKGFELVRFYLSNPKNLLADLHCTFSMAALGTWEKRKESSARVERSKRKNYSCGGTWWGLRSNILELCDLLSARVRSDEEKGITALWHDESHLNWWSSRHPHGFSDPQFCYVTGYPQLQGISPIIEARVKT